MSIWQNQALPCLPTFTFQLLCFLVLPNYKTQRPPGAEQSSEYFTIRHNFSIPPTTHMLCVCVCFCVRVIGASHSVSHCYLGKQCFWFDCNSKQTLYSSKTICHFSISHDNCISLLCNVAKSVSIIFNVTKIFSLNINNQSASFELMILGILK